MLAEIASNLSLGLSIAASPEGFLFLVIGAFLGMIVGLFPGFGPAAGIAVLIPMTFLLQPTIAIIMLAGIYYGSMYGGTITSILINTPGESATVASTIDGYPLAKKGRAGPALVMQAIASFFGGTIGVILITALAPSLANFAASFGPSEYFLIIAVGLLMLTTMMGDNKFKGFISALIGFAIGTIGARVMSGQQRYTFGSPELIGGVYFVAVAIGLFAAVLPGSGATPGSIIGYSVEKKTAQVPQNSARARCTASCLAAWQKRHSFRPISSPKAP